jgi:hypothetical protein
VSQCHPKEKIKLIKNNTTTPLTPQKPGSGSEGSIPRTVANPELPHSSKGPLGPVVVDVVKKFVNSTPPAAKSELPDSSRTASSVVDEIKKLINGTPFEKLNEQSLRIFAKRYGAKRLFDSLDMLIAIYTQSGTVVKDPVALLTKALFKGVTPPFDYVPYHLRIENERKAREAAAQRRMAESQKKKAEEEAYSRLAAEFDALPEQDKEVLVNRAKAKLSPVLRGFKYSVRSMAIELYRGG